MTKIPCPFRDSVELSHVVLKGRVRPSSYPNPLSDNVEDEEYNESFLPGDLSNIFQNIPSVTAPILVVKAKGTRWSFPIQKGQSARV